MRSLVNAYLKAGLVPMIITALVLGAIVGALLPYVGVSVGILGAIFVGALKAVAPILVFVLVVAAVTSYRGGGDLRIKPVFILYLFGRLPQH